jgi:adenine deaminase
MDDLMDVSLGKKEADLAIVNGQIVNVYTKEIYPGGVAVAGNIIVAVGDVGYCIGSETKVIDAEGKYILPGFIDGHIHPESTNLSIRQFAEAVLFHGTTSIMADLHEVGVVGGLAAIEAVLEEAKATPLKIFFVVPSHVPFAPGLETSGGIFDSKVIEQAFQRPDAVGLSEIVGPYLLQKHPELMKAIEISKSKRKSLQGHLPHISGPELQSCMVAGVATDHESLSAEEALEKVRLGCHLMMREGSVARNLAECLKVITEHHVDPSMCSIVTDDLYIGDLVDKGHLDESLRTALANGIDFVTAVQMLTLNAARAYELDRYIGSLAPGRAADILITTGPEDFKVKTVIANGKLIVNEEKLLERFPVAEHHPILLNTTKLAQEIRPEDLTIKVDPQAKTARVMAMRTLDWIPITSGEECELEVKDGVIQASLDKDILYIAQVERHGKNGNIGKAFMAGFNLKAGAIASTVGHDNHNIIVLGTNHADMAVAVNRLVEVGGGQIVVNNGQILYEVQLPVVGLLSDLDAWDLAQEKKILNHKVQELGSTISLPFMFLSFISLAAIPDYAITDYGFIDVMQQKVIDPVLALEY